MVNQFQLVLLAAGTLTSFLSILPAAWAAALDEPGSATATEAWLAQTEILLVQITGVQVETTETSLQVVLETVGGELISPATRTVRNALVAEIPNAVLALPEGERFEQFGPAEGIAVVSVTSLPDDRVEVAITGTDAPPEVQVSVNAGNLVLSVVPGTATTADVDEDTIQLVVTATRTEEEIQDISRSVTVITREEIEEQTNLTTNLADILGQLVPGLGPPTQGFVDFGQSLRGRQSQILINGVPITSNQRSFPSGFRSIAPGAIERIEVVRGPSATFGDGATGGVINIITRQPEEDFTQTIEARVNSRGDLAAESFGTYLEYGLSGQLGGPFDGLFSFSWERFGFAFDGAGDQIPGEDSFIENGRSINVLGILGADIGENQRLQFSVNHLDEDSDAEFINDRSVDDDPDAEKARAIPFDFECIDIQCGDDRRYTTLSLNYNHDDIFDSQLRLQGFYRREFSRNGFPFLDDFSTSPLSAGRFSTLEQESERFGGRLEVETPFSETFNLLWGADYSSEDASQTRLILDAVDTNQQTRLELFEEAIQTPPYTTENLGLFAQAQWDITPRWLISGGVRYENIGLRADDYTLIAFENPPRDIEGGSINADDVVFNLGTIYDLTEELNIFASFSQGFGVPDFGVLLRNPPGEFRSLEDDLDFTTPQKVNNYELGFRGQWQTVQFSLAGFYNDSDLGVTLVRNRDAQLIRLARAPERVYGIEATVDWQPSQTWQLGGLISWNEGENDLDDDGDFEPFDSTRIQPIKITAYVENETLPGWRNRLQSLFVGGRDRAFDPDTGPDFNEIESYFVLDYISSIQLGPGTLQVGIQNLLDEEYFPVSESQLVTAFGTSNRVAAPGRTISIGYRVNF